MTEKATTTKRTQEELDRDTAELCLRFLEQRGLEVVTGEAVPTAQLVCRDGDGTAVLVQVRAYGQDGEDVLPPIGLSADEYAALRHLIGAYCWEE